MNGDAGSGGPVIDQLETNGCDDPAFFCVNPEITPVEARSVPWFSPKSAPVPAFANFVHGANIGR
jgi:hypothetical protein